jgi:predicted dienelactone hydrolase
MPNGTYAGTAARQLLTEIWYPTAPGAIPPVAQRDAALALGGARFPLVMYSHGYSDTRLSGGPLGSHLASHGYIVAAIDFPLSNIGAPGGPTVNDVPEQPLDISFVIDQLLAPGGRFAAAIDADRIALTGLSLGGLTTFIAAYHPELGDPRVRAAAPIAGLACYFTPAYYAASHLPLLILHGDLDALVGFDSNAAFAYANANPPKTLVTAHNASHTGFSPAGAGLPGDNPDDFGCTFLLAQLESSPPDNQALVSRLGGAANGVDLAACTDPCTAPRPLPPSLSGARQLEIANLVVFPFFESVLRDDRAMRRFLDEGLAAENAELSVQHED